MSGLEADQAYRKFDIPESAHSAVLQEASSGRPWTPEVVDAPGVEIDGGVYAEGVLKADPREKQDRHDLLVDGRLERYRQNIEEGKNRWDLVLVEQDFYQHPGEFDVDEDIEHNRDPEDELRKGDADLLFLDLDEYDMHMVEVKPHDGYTDSGNEHNSQSDTRSWEDPLNPDYSSGNRSQGEERPGIYDFVAETYPEASQEDTRDLIENYPGLDEEVVFSVLSQMSDFEWTDVETELQRVAEKEEVPVRYQTDPESFSQHTRGRESSNSTKEEDENLSPVEKKTRNLKEAWKTVKEELENDWTVYQPEFVFGSDVVDNSTLSNNTEYALPPSYDQSTGYVFGTDKGFSRAEDSDDLEVLNETFFRGGITELLEGERPEMERKTVI